MPFKREESIPLTYVKRTHRGNYFAVGTLPVAAATDSSKKHVKTVAAFNASLNYRLLLR
jgi:hypothetical protein